MSVGLGRSAAMAAQKCTNQQGTRHGCCGSGDKYAGAAFWWFRPGPAGRNRAQNLKRDGTKKFVGDQQGQRYAQQPAVVSGCTAEERATLASSHFEARKRRGGKRSDSARGPCLIALAMDSSDQFQPPGRACSNLLRPPENHQKKSWREPQQTNTNDNL